MHPRPPLFRLVEGIFDVLFITLPQSNEKLRITSRYEDKFKNINNLKNTNRMKRLKNVTAIALCGVFMIALMSASKYDCAPSDDHPVYSAELVQRAEKGDAAALFDLGWCYEFGRGVTHEK